MLLVCLNACTRKHILIETPPPQQETPEKAAPPQPSPKPTPPPLPAAKPPEAKIPQKPLPTSTPDKSAPAPPSPPKPPETNRAKAALELTRKAIAYLTKSQPDSAISLLERAINMDSQNGETYFYMAQAWIMKGNPDQALQFNRLAEIRLGTVPEWQARIAEQRERIQEGK